MLNHAHAIDAVIERTPHGDIARDVVAAGVDHVAFHGHIGASGVAGQRDAAGVHRSAVEQRVTRGNRPGQRRRGVGHVRRARLGGGQRRVLFHKQHYNAVHERFLAVIVGVGAQDHLLAAIPLLQHIAAAADGVLTVIGPVGVGRHDAHHGERVQQRIVRALHGDLAGYGVNGPRLVHHGQIRFGRFAVHDSVDGEGHVLGRERHAVGEHHALADMERPGEAVLGAAVIGGEIVHEGEVVVRGDERRLDERLVHVLAGPPPHERIEAGGRFRGGRHGDYHLAYAVGTDAGTRRAGSHRFVRARVCRSPCAPRQKRDAPRRSGKSRCTHEVPSRQGHGFSSCWCYVSSMRNNTIGEPPVLRNFDS